MISDFRRGFFRPAPRKCLLPKETLWTIWGQLGLVPIPPTSATHVTELFLNSEKQIFCFLGLIFVLMLAIFTQTSSVTKKNIMDKMDKVVGMAYTPH